jgi:hypothetical protein
MAGLEAGRRFSEVVLAARAAGYTEPDPRDDLAGTDVGRKVSPTAPCKLLRDMTWLSKWSIQNPECASDDHPAFTGAVNISSL